MRNTARPRYTALPPDSVVSKTNVFVDRLFGHEVNEAWVFNGLRILGELARILVCFVGGGERCKPRSRADPHRPTDAIGIAVYGV